LDGIPRNAFVCSSCRHFGDSDTIANDSAGQRNADSDAFEKEQLPDVFLDRFKTSQPDLAKTADIQVLP
jgi:hypothetical protein